MISIKHYRSQKTFQKSIDRHNNILIIGAGATDYELNKIVYFSSDSVVYDLYGDSPLYEAFKTAKDFGVQDVFVANVHYKTDYIELIDTIKHYDFAYIVPLGIKFSDTFFNPVLNRIMSYTELLLDQIGSSSNATIIMTDFHASLYEDVDAFLTDMFEKIESFNSIAYKARSNGRNLCLTANNLQNYSYSNLMLAIALCVTDYKTYPTVNFGDVVFNIDDFDIGNYELIYFKKNFLAGTTVENLKNFRIENDAAKIVTIDKVIKFIERELDFSDYTGKVFTEYLRLKLYDKLSLFFQSITNKVLRAYKINSVEFRVTAPGEGDIINKFTVYPLGSVEGFDIMMEA